ncbi:MAG: type IX secretion system membrane protein PorP/SprF, partial [Bacteroidia bacterium]|nr:type IX secretion system membrane protein PorP/SprF [Bacteroidia bacterium]
INIRRGWRWTTSGLIPKAQIQNYDLSSGLLINFKNTFFGASVFHMNEPDEGLIGVSKMPYRLNVHASHNYFASEKLLLNFYTQYTKQYYFEFFKLQTSALLYQHFLVSAGLSNNNNTMLGAGYHHHLFCLTLNYDVNISKLSGNTIGSWELNASFNLREKEKRNEIVCFENW